jgi:hypothetical protein
MQICEYNYERFFLSFQRKHREVLLECEVEQKHNTSIDKSMGLDNRLCLYKSSPNNKMEQLESNLHKT